MKTGYIGKGKKTHFIVPHKFYFFNFWEKGLCGKHGRIKYTETPVTCRLCLRCAGEVVEVRLIESTFAVRTGEHILG